MTQSDHDLLDSAADLFVPLWWHKCACAQDMCQLWEEER